MDNLDYNIDGYMNLAAAVVEMAVKDYARALKRLGKFPRDQDAQRTVRECERFFRNNVGRYMLAEIDGETIIRAIRERVEYGDNSRRGKLSGRSSKDGTVAGESREEGLPERL